MRYVIALLVFLGVIISVGFATDYSGCVNISSSGSHRLIADVSGANISTPYVGVKACILISAPDVTFDCNGHTITGDGSTIAYGIAVFSPATRVAIQNCPMITNYTIGVFADNYTNVTNVVAVNNTAGTVYNSGIQIIGPYNRIINNTVDGSTWGIIAESTPSYGNVIADNTVSNAQEGIYLVIGSNDNLVSGNTVHDCSYEGIYDQEGAGNTIVGNTVYNSLRYGIALLGDNPDVVANSTFANNVVYNSGMAPFYYPFYFERGIGINVTNNTARDNSFGGFFFYSDSYGGFSNSNIINNSAYNNNGDGFDLVGYWQHILSYNNFTGNLAQNNSGDGFGIGDSSENNSFTDNIASNNSLSGFYIHTTSYKNNSLANDTAYGNLANGLYINDSTISVSGGHYYGNGHDFRAEAAIADLSSVIFDNPAGDFTNYTNLSLSDDLGGFGDAYWIDWSAQPASPPFYLEPVGDKFVNITVASGSVSIDSINWTWSDADASGHNPANFKIYKFDSGAWSDAGAALDEPDNTLSLSGLVPSSAYGIMEDITSEFVPTQGVPILNSTYGTNFTYENLTVYNQSTYDPLGGNVTNTIDWQLNGTSVGLLNAPFDKNVSGISAGAIRDYSTYGYNGTLGEGNPSYAPAWVPDGYNGGAYDFDGTQYIEFPPVLSGAEDFTLAAWVKTTQNQSAGAPYDDPGIMGNVQGPGATSDIVLTNQNGKLAWFDELNGYNALSSNAVIADGNWHHVAVTRKGVYLKLYVDGAVVASGTTGTLPVNGNDFEVGRAYWTDPSLDFIGQIDGVMVYDRALSTPQVRALSNNRTDVMVSNELQKYDVWDACITPDNGFGDGQTECSNNVTMDALSNCAIIDSPGIYQMNYSFSGAPNPGYPPSRPDCVDINASNVVFDCNGYAITNDETSLATGIFIDGIYGPRTNVTIRNCPSISGYEMGVWALNTSDSVFTNLTISDISDTAIFVGSWWDSTLGGAGNSVLNSSISSAFFGISFQNSPEGVISGNEISNVDATEIFTYFSDGSNIMGNTLVGPALPGGPYGIENSYGNGVLVADNNISDMGTEAIFLYYCNGNTIINNSVVAASGTTGFHPYGGFGNNLTANSFDGNSTANVGFLIDGETNDFLSNNTALNAVISGFDIEYGSYNNLTNNLASNNGQTGFILHSTDSNILVFNNATNNGDDGFFITDYSSPGGSYNNLTSNLAENNAHYGFVVDSTDHDQLNANLALNNSVGGIYLNNSVTNTIFDNTVDNVGYGGEYVASNQYFNYDSTLYDSVGFGTGVYIVPIEDLSHGPCETISDPDGNASLSACPGFDGTTDLSVALTSFSPSDHSTIMVNADLNNCADFYDAGGPGTCAFTCVLYTPNGRGNDYTLNASCLSSISLADGLPDPPYVSFVPNSIGIQLDQSADNLIYNNIFNASRPAIDEAGSLNSWNTAQQAGPNIIGGQDIGGNYYPDYAGVDTNGDGIGDTPYAIRNLAGSVVNHDELPLTNTLGGTLCNASVIVPPEDISVLQNNTFDVKTTVECCGNVTCQGVQATVSYLHNGPANVTYDYSDGRDNVARADNEYFGAHTSACKNESVGQGFDNCATPATSANITALSTPDSGAAVQVDPSSFQESFASASVDTGRIGYYAFTRFAFDVSNYTVGSNSPAYFSWRGYTGACRVSAYQSWERNDGYLLYGRNSSGDYVLLANDTSNVNTRSLTDDSHYISDIDQYINASDGTAEFVVEATYPTWSFGVNGRGCGGSAVETDYVALKIGITALLTNAISTSPSATPFSSLSENPANSVCMESMEPGTYCNATWTINATGIPISTWSLLSAYTGTNVDQLDTGSFNVTITKPELCNASITWPSSNITVAPNAVFNVTSTVACCGNSSCGDVEAALFTPALVNVSLNVPYNYSDGRGNAVYAHSESGHGTSYPPPGTSTLSTCKNESLGQGFDNCNQLENASETAKIATIDAAPTVLATPPGAFLESLDSANFSNGPFGFTPYYAFTRFVFNLSDYALGSGDAASFRWVGYTGTCRVDASSFQERNDGYLLYARNSSGSYELLANDTSQLGTADLNDNVTSISDIDQYINASDGTAEFVVEATYPTGTGGVNGACGGSSVETDYAELNISEQGLANGSAPLTTNPSAVPFFTSDPNPRYASDIACLQDLGPGDSCNTTWMVDASGGIGNSSDFFVLYNQQLQTNDVNVTIAGESAPPPNVTLVSPADSSNASRRLVTFNCSAITNLSLSSITLYGNFTGSWQANQTNSVGGTSNSTTFTLDLPYGHYSWNCLASDTDGNSAWAPANYTFTADSLPLVSNFGGSTTDFNAELDLTNVSTPVLENPTYGLLQWNNSGLDVAGADFNSYVLFGNGTISVDSSHLSPTLNSPANITLYGLPYQYTPVVYADGVLCTSECTILSYISNNFAFSVPHFTNYSAGPNTNLAIYDQYEGSNVSKLTPITFYANYTNATDNSHVAGATCTISFDDATSGTMVDTGTQYNYTKAAGFATTGTHLWNVTCNETGYEPLFAQDDILIGVLNMTGNQTSLYQANVTNATALPRFEYNGSGNLSTEGGNITGSDIYTEMLTDRWAAFYGNITGSIMLTDKEGANNVYQWGWTPASGGVVCSSTNSSVTDLILYPADGDDIDAAWSFVHSEPDSGRNTFNQTGCDLTIGTTPITGAGYADTGQAGGFVTCSLKDTTNAAKQDMYFCTNITENGVFWNNELGDFELMVPTTFGSNQYETYYFYVNLD